MYAWNQEKNKWLKEHRNITFESIVEIIKSKKKTLDIIDHPNQSKYPGQRMYVVMIDMYCYIIPFVEDAQRIFLKTIYRSRKATKNYIRKRR